MMNYSLFYIFIRTYSSLKYLLEDYFMAIYTYKVMLLLNNKQETRIRQTMNKCIECQNIIYDLLDGCLKHHLGLPKCKDVRKLFTDLKKIYDAKIIEERKGLTKASARAKHLDVLFSDVSNDALKQTIRDTYNAFVRFLTKKGGYPIRKKYNDFHKGFYVDTCKIEFNEKKVRLEKISTSTKSNRKVVNWVKLAEKNRIPIGVKYYNPRIVLEKDRFFLTVGVDEENRPVKKREKLVLTDETIGIDVNIHNINLSNEKEYKTSTTSIVKTDKKVKNTKRKLSRQYEQFKKDKKHNKDLVLKSRKNYQKTKKLLSKKYTRLTNLRTQRYNEIINDIILSAPKCIAVETLSVKEMMKTKKVSRGMQKAAFRKFMNLLENRLRYTGIKLVKIDKYYPSSKLCSCCGHKKEDLTLKDRVYKCDKCGLEIKRDYNAAINIRNYALNL